MRNLFLILKESKIEKFYLHLQGYGIIKMFYIMICLLTCNLKNKLKDEELGSEI